MGQVLRLLLQSLSFIIKLGGIFSRGRGVVLTVLFPLLDIGGQRGHWKETRVDEGVVPEKFLVEEV